TFRKGKFPKLWQIERSIVLAEYGGLKIVDSDMITIVIELLDAMNKLALFLRKRHDHKTVWVISCITSLRLHNWYQSLVALDLGYYKVLVTSLDEKKERRLY
ncbi:hypothetical protein Tco_1442267, partial [Tanacetum coccineum]